MVNSNSRFGIDYLKRNGIGIEKLKKLNPQINLPFLQH